MIAYLSGEVAQKNADSLVIDVGGVGFFVFATQGALATAQLGAQLKLPTKLVVREGSWDIYGFATMEEKAMFDKLTAVSGVGPRSALMVLSTLGVHDLAIAIVTGDVKSIKKVPGIGIKTAQRLMLELKDKVENEELVGNFAGSAGAPVAGTGPAQDAIAALMALGYDSSEAASAVSAVAGDSDDAQDLIRLALRSMSKMK